MMTSMVTVTKVTSSALWMKAYVHRAIPQKKASLKRLTKHLKLTSFTNSIYFLMILWNRCCKTTFCYRAVVSVGASDQTPVVIEASLQKMVSLWNNKYTGSVFNY